MPAKSVEVNKNENTKKAGPNFTDTFIARRRTNRRQE
jgi:hypothetical protein